MNDGVEKGTDEQRGSVLKGGGEKSGGKVSLVKASVKK